MVFSTIVFLCVFLPIVIFGYFILPSRFRNIFLLLASLFFYAWGEPKFIWIMLLSILINYLFGMALHKFAFDEKDRTKEKKVVAVFGVLSNLVLLFVFKYAGFVSEAIRTLLNGKWDIIELALPIGISFYTFQGLSYIIDIYREEGTVNEKGEKISIVQKNPLQLALYISMFPQLIAGPIVRYEDIRKELTERKCSMALFAEGTERFIIGLAKKAILANMTGKLAESIFMADFAYLGAAVAWIGAIAYTLQIYFDFSGYSDMAIGLGKIFGFHFNENFEYPYISKSIREFWRRWHISLSTWFRDYLYIPLGGNRKGNVYFNLLLVFVATGIWHGADWGFLLWGLWHGLFMLLERMGSNYLKQKNKTLKIPVLVSRVYTMLVVINGWVLFRLVDVKDTLTYLSIMFGIRQNEFVAYEPGYYLTNQSTFFLVLACVCALPILPWIRKKVDTQNVPILLLRRGELLVLLALSFMFIINSTYNPFIYFRF